MKGLRFCLWVLPRHRRDGKCTSPFWYKDTPLERSHSALISQLKSPSSTLECSLCACPDLGLHVRLLVQSRHVSGPCLSKSAGSRLGRSVVASVPAFFWKDVVLTFAVYDNTDFQNAKSSGARGIKETSPSKARSRRGGPVCSPK